MSYIFEFGLDGELKELGGGYQVRCGLAIKESDARPLLALNVFSVLVPGGTNSYQLSRCKIIVCI